MVSNFFKKKNLVVMYSDSLHFKLYLVDTLLYNIHLQTNFTLLNGISPRIIHLFICKVQFFHLLLYMYFFYLFHDFLHLFFYLWNVSFKCLIEISDFVNIFLSSLHEVLRFFNCERIFLFSCSIFIEQNCNPTTKMPFNHITYIDNVFVQ